MAIAYCSPATARPGRSRRRPRSRHAWRARYTRPVCKPATGSPSCARTVPSFSASCLAAAGSAPSPCRSTRRSRDRSCATCWRTRRRACSSSKITTPRSWSIARWRACRSTVFGSSAIQAYNALRAVPSKHSAITRRPSRPPISSPPTRWRSSTRRAPRDPPRASAVRTPSSTGGACTPPASSTCARATYSAPRCRCFTQTRSIPSSRHC